jgi:SAM-dependent methyltransferase
MSVTPGLQPRQREWAWQWERFVDAEEWLFRDWIHPVALEDFRGKRVMDAGCGGGAHMAFVAPYAAEVVGVDLNATHVAARRVAGFTNARTVDGDIATFASPEGFDVVYSIGVIHHTDDPDRTFANLASLTKPGGRTVVWVYAHEGNFFNRVFVEGAKWLFVRRLPQSSLSPLARLCTALLYLPVHTIYRLPLRWLPYYEYFQNFRKLGFARNMLNVVDKLNAPTTWFIRRSQIEGWFRDHGYRDVHVSHYAGVSWRGSGTKA